MLRTLLLYFVDPATANEYLIIFNVMYQAAFVLVPLLLIRVTWQLWINYVRSKFNFEQKWVLLEIKLPREVYKSPLAMEVVLTSLFQTGGEGTFIDRLWYGKTRPWFSLELVSLEGQVKFYMWTRPIWKDLIEAQIYAQYPGIEVLEVPDYSKAVVYNKDHLVLWGCEFLLTKPDPYPIKTYVDYEFKPGPALGGSFISGAPHAAHMVDPISPVIEYLGSLGPGEQAWIQIMVRAHKNDRRSFERSWRKPLSLFKKVDWKDALKSEVGKLRKKEKEGGKLTRSEEETIEAMEKSTSKFPFEVGIRALYMSIPESFNPVNISGLTGSFRQYNSNNLNGFKPARGLTIFSYPWQDYKDIRKESIRRRLLDAYKHRSYFMTPYKRKHFILNTEELATIFHFPGSVVTTPTLARVTSNRGEPPSNLPV